MLVVRYLRVHMSAGATSSPDKFSRFGKFNYFHTRLKPEIIKSELPYFKPGKSSPGNFFAQRIRQYAEKICNSGSKVTIKNMVVCSAIGSMSLWPRIAYCADGVCDNHQRNSWPALPPGGKSLSGCATWAHKLIVPLFFVLTILLGRGKSHPLFLCIRVVLIFLFTEPAPYSIHTYFNQLWYHIMRQQPKRYKCNPYYAKRVETIDYRLWCVAKIHLKDEKLMLIGILGNWWFWPLSSWNEVLVFDKLSYEKLISSIKNKLRIADEMGLY